jgi:hypothetical protein
MKIKERKEICLIINDINIVPKNKMSINKKLDMIKTRKIN